MITKILLAVMFTGGIIMTCYAVDLLQTGWDKSGWPVTKGVVLESQVTGDKRAFQPKITYSFELDSIFYQNTTDLHISGFGNKRSRRDNATRITQEYPAGRIITVHYNPENPSESCLRTGPYWSDYMKLMVGSMIVLTSCYFLIATYRKPVSQDHHEIRYEPNS